MVWLDHNLSHHGMAGPDWITMHWTMTWLDHHALDHGMAGSPRIEPSHGMAGSARSLARVSAAPTARWAGRPHPQTPVLQTMPWARLCADPGFPSPSPSGLLTAGRARALPHAPGPWRAFLPPRDGPRTAAAAALLTSDKRYGTREAIEAKESFREVFRTRASCCGW